MRGVTSDARGWLARAVGLAARRACKAKSYAARLTYCRRRLSCGAERRDARSGGAEQNTDAATVMKIGQFYKPIYADETTARVRAALTTDRPFIERLTYLLDESLRGFRRQSGGVWARRQFRARGDPPSRCSATFTDLLLASTRHPAMLLYLDNQTSVGSNSMLARRAERHASEHRFGINENLAREILELQTLGVAGGYTTSRLSRSFAQAHHRWSSWRQSLGHLTGGGPGQFTFRPEMHEPGAQVVLGKRYTEEAAKSRVSRYCATWRESCHREFRRDQACAPFHRR